MRAFADSTGPGHHPRGLPGGLSGSAEFDFRVFLVPSPRPRPRRVSYAKQPLNEAAIAGSKGCRPPLLISRSAEARSADGKAGKPLCEALARQQTRARIRLA